MVLLQNQYMGSRMNLYVRMSWGENPDLKYPWFIRYDYQFVIIEEKSRILLGAGDKIWVPDEFFTFIGDFAERTKNDFPVENRLVRNFFKRLTGVYLFRFKNQHDLIKARLGS